MSVKKRPNGKFRARYRDEAGKEYARHFDTEVEAYAWETQQRSSVYRGTHIAPAGRSRTLTEYFEEEYLKRRDLETNTVYGYRRVLENCPLKDYQLGKITRRSIEHWIQDMRKAGRKDSTIVARYACLRAILKAARADRLISEDPMLGVEVKRRRKSATKLRIPTPAQAGRLLNAAPDPTTKVFFCSQAFAGLRIGEVPGLQPQDLHYKDLELTVERQVQFPPPRRMEVRAPKYDSVRDVPISQEYADLLLEQIELVGAKPGEWIFPGATPDRPFTQTRWNNQLSDMREAAGVPAGVSHSHALRHFYASGLIAAKCDVVTVQKAMGHARPSMTLDVYSHLWETADDSVRSASRDLMASVRLSADSPQSTV